MKLGTKVTLCVALTQIPLLFIATMLSIHQDRQDILDAVGWRALALSDPVQKRAASLASYSPEMQRTLGLNVDCQTLLEENRDKELIQVGIIGPNGQVIAHTDPQTIGTRIPLEINGKRRPQTEIQTSLNRHAFDTLIPFRIRPDQPPAGFIGLSFSRESINQNVRDTLLSSTAFFFTFLTFSFLLISGLLKKVITGPVAKLSRAVSDLTEGQTPDAVAVTGAKEIRLLADSFNHMGQRIKHRELQLREAEKKSRAWLEHSPACTKIVDLDLNLQYMSGAGIRGLEIDDVTTLYGHPYPFTFYPESFKTTMTGNLIKAKETGAIITQEAPVVDTHGTELWFHSTIVPVRDDAGEVEYLIVVSIDTTERRTAEKQLAEEKERLAVTLTSIGDAVITTDTEGNIELMNPIAETLTGWSLRDATGRPLIEVFNIISSQTREPAENPADKVLETGQIVGMANHTALIAKNGTEYQIADSGAPIRDRNNIIIGVVLVFRDVTEEYAMQERLRQSQKMEAIGQLAGGIAHDFNNMLGGIMGAAELLELELADTPNAKKFHSMILDSATRAADLTSKLLAFARKQQQASTAIDIHHIIQEAVTLLESSMDRRINFDVTLDADVSNIIGDAAQLQNAVMNLAINSSHAMPEGGTIAITSQTLKLDEAYCTSSIFEINPGAFVEIEIRDSGQGIPPEDLPHIFEPFFTTKGQGKGTGLGLAAVYGTVQQHHGAITAYSEIGKGTSFHIYLPLTGESAAASAPQTAPIRGSGTLLVVDDEPAMRATSKAILEDLGYAVDTAKNGAEGLTLFKANPRKYDLVLLDMIMPVMSGKECFGEMLKIDPRVRVVLASGFTKEEDLDEMKKRGLRGFISKPFRRHELSQVVHNAMRETGG